jgi:hypothetical protein
MTDGAPSTEQRILRLMRKVLAGVIKDTTPAPGMKHVLSEKTIRDVRDCLALISARENDLAVARGVVPQERPVYADQARGSTVVPVSRAGLPKKPNEP